MQDVVAQLDQIRRGLTYLYKPRGLSLPDNVARTRLYGDVFVDALIKRNYLDTNLSVGELFWLPQCIACCDLGRLTMPTDPGQLPTSGLALLDRIEQSWGSRPFSTTLREIISGLYERWDGQGFPTQLSGHQIPLTARIAVIVQGYASALSLSVADDARFYNSALEKVYDGQGQRYDPDLVEIFLGAAPDLRSVDQYFVGQPYSVACA